MEERIQAIEGKISEVEKQIEECDANITIATSEQMRGYWIEEENQLRREEEQLREEKIELLIQETELLKRLPTPGASAFPTECSSHRDAPVPLRRSRCLLPFTDARLRRLERHA